MTDKGFIRKKSASVASMLGIDIPSSLPLLEEIEYVRPEQEIVGRLLSLTAVMACAVGYPKARGVMWLDVQGVRGLLTKDELRFLTEDVGDPRRFQVVVEAMWALAWAVQMVDTLGMLTPCSDDFASMLPNLKRNESGSELLLRAQVRPQEEIEQALDTAYCLHWALNEVSFGGITMKRTIEPYMIVERRRALEWVTHEDDWEDLTLDT